METKNKSENENKNEFSFLFSFCFSFLFCFLFLLFKIFCIFVNSTWPRGAIDGQLSLDWPRSAIAFLLNPRGLEVPQTVNSLLIGLEVSLSLSLYLSLSYLAQKCHRIFDCEFSMRPSGAIDGQLSLDWPRSAIAPRNVAPSLIRICRIQ